MRTNKMQSTQTVMEETVPKNDPFFNDLNSITISGKTGGTPMVSRSGKQTIAQYLCFSNGLPPKPMFANGYDESKLPLEILQEKLRNELQGINKDVIQEYFAKLNIEYQKTLEEAQQLQLGVEISQNMLTKSGNA